MEAVIQSAAPGSGVTQSDHQHSVGSGKTPAAAEGRGHQAVAAAAMVMWAGRK
jgi:hypothetical protein